LFTLGYKQSFGPKQEVLAISSVGQSKSGRGGRDGVGGGRVVLCVVGGGGGRVGLAVVGFGLPMIPLLVHVD
jgi:hypothetical protein